MERLSKCLPMTCCKTFRTLASILIMGLVMPSTTNAEKRYKEFLIHQANGSFWSPGYPNPYPANIYYEWVFPYIENVILVEFVDMDLYRCYTPDDHQNCLDYDYVLVENHGAAYCNWYLPSGPLSLGPHAETRIIFRTLDKKEACRGKGFKATFKTIAPSTSPKVLLTTPTMATTVQRKTKSSKELYNGDMKTIIIIGTIILVLSIVAGVVCCCHRKMKNRRRQQSERSESQSRDRTSSYSALPQRGELIELAGQASQIDRSQGDIDVHVEAPPRPRGPPPSYDSVAPEDSIDDFESPPSYESVIRGELSVNSRRSSQRSNRSRESPQRRHVGHNTQNSIAQTRHSERSRIPQTTPSRESSEGPRIDHSRNQQNEEDGHTSTVSQRTGINTSLSRDAAQVPRTLSSENHGNEFTNERDAHSEHQPPGHPLSRDDSETSGDYYQENLNSTTVNDGVPQEEPSQQRENPEIEAPRSTEANTANSREVFV